MPKNIIQKIWDDHLLVQRPDHPAVLAIDKMLLHEVTSAQAFNELRRRGLKVRYPERIIATLDHSIPTSKNRSNIEDIQAKRQVEALRNNTKESGIKLYDFDSRYQGIVHVMGPELGFTLPGTTIVCGDSHTSTHGAFGALAFGIGTSEVAHVLATGAILQYQPKTMKVEFLGKLPLNITAKDVIMKLIATIGMNGATGYIIEYMGTAISNMSMEARMTLCNMSIECGARAGLIAPDEITFNYLQDRPYTPKDKIWRQSVEKWRTLKSDSGCYYNNHIQVDISALTPMVTWGINPEQAIAINELIPVVEKGEQAYAYTKLRPGQAIKNQPVDWAFIGSCTNGRIEDLRLAAEILKGRKIARHVRLYIVPGSEQVMLQAIAEGLDKIFIASGAEFRMPGCSMCLAMNADKVPAGARCISTSNRNFMGRQGPGSITHLASPATVAASAIKGAIVSVEEI
ncbi:MAG: 3-isopropylmalate dehydratase large subunit [Gammaproteobacteria bacterium RIFCSPHIGHO2_12_FULL_35_23]|nr:MAG: 3-isopropylmalate dehydratase large subunit [Gammaproteobacteria bacterium RIFCSPHIGHO2_12_FULL_35_23]